MSVDAALRAIAEPNRRAILRLVRDDERSAGDIAAHFDVSRPAISQHLRVLADAGLVAVRRDGTRRLYRAQPEALADVRKFLESFWDDRLARLKGAVEFDQRRRVRDARRRKGNGRGRT
ncbi:MAG: ArsR/SmtB family transcription factor [Acidimicrobiia bacterium]